MNRVFLFLFAAVGVGLLILSADLAGQPGKKGPAKGKGIKGKGGVGFERPLAKEPRRGNPGASPNLTDADFKDIVAAAKSFDTNKDGKLQKSEVPELYARLFDRADSNHDGVLDQAEQSRVLNGSATTAPAVGGKKAGPTKKSTDRP